MTIVLPEKPRVWTPPPPSRRDLVAKEFWVDTPFTKAVEDAQKGDLILKGYASTWGLDRDQEYVDPRAFDNSLAPYLEKNPIVLWQHNPMWPLGQVREAATDQYGLNVAVVVRKPQDGEAEWKVSAYYDIAAGIVRTFSIGGYMYRDIIGGRMVIVEVELFEISCVSIPANPDSIYEAAVKSLAVNGGGRPTLPQKAIDQMQQVLGLKATSDPELARMDEGALAERYDYLSRLYEKSGVRPPAYGAWKQVQGIEDPHERGEAIVDLLKHVQGMVRVKRGRVLSKRNEDALQRASDLLAEVLSQVREQPDGDEDEAAAAEEADAAALARDVARRLSSLDPTLYEQLATDSDAEAKGVTPFKDLPLAPRARPWDAGAADKRVRAWADATEKPTAKYRQAHLYVDAGGGDNYGDYHFLFADVIDGELQACPRGIFACAVILQGGRGGADNFPDAAVAGMKRHLGRYYAKMRTEFQDDGIQAPWDS